MLKDSMSVIKILPENLVNQIAAGEVVERPSSVVKELVENSIDAGAGRVLVDVRDGGKTFIKITDNGCGMSRDDLEMALQRHATSKISSEADLWKIKTMGFRGEALASIASVSKMVIKSKTAGEVGGAMIECNGGDMVSANDVGMSDGTVIEVYDLFFNTPARQKYLKKESTELGQITSTMNNIALANPSVAFKLIHNGKAVFDLAPVTDLISRVRDVFGVATAEAMIPVFYGGSSFQVEGFVGKPALSRSTTKHQYFFVNGRYVQHFLLAHSIKSAFHSMLMENKKPVFVINITIDPSLIDVNVHPRKLEVRFEDQQRMIRTMYSCVKAALEKESLTPLGITESKRYMSDSFPKENNYAKAGNVQDAISFSKDFLAERDSRQIQQTSLPTGISEEEEEGMQAISQVSESYIVAQDQGGLVLIDQHAAHERVRYEQLMDQYENEQKAVQPLLVPLQIEFSGDEVSVIEDNKEIFDGLGFDVEHFGGKTFVVNGVPAFLSGEDAEGVIKGVLDDILNESKPSRVQGFEEVINYMACRSAIKFGQKLSLGEMQVLIDDMSKLERPYTCPHGRPTMISLTLSELEKMFGRK
ncbi:MAG: DNA mismatch repair endonuclease MutL [Nitrospirota bacterium]